eukprot:gb/GECG01016380.1/.p1 GENE.gb/GECG01016380.1/~~gb/GECG01016380.1/.p1  ORF type:complete len:543 (+),score=94.12 gb/GECG01016380.1/:1-1629(+)
MVVLSAAVCDHNGKAIVGRQFVNMAKPRAEGLLAAFPKLLSGETGKQHTYIESDNVRYVYQPLEDLYVVIVTNKNSNIVQDLDTIKLLTKVIPETVGMASEEAVNERMFEIIFAFDEVITQGGHREEVNLEQVRTNLEMESHEERLAQMIKQSKENEAKEQSKRQQQQIRQKKREEQQRQQNMPPGMSSAMQSGTSTYGGVGSQTYGGIGSDSVGMSGSAGARSGIGSGTSASATPPASYEEKRKPQGMKLGGKKENKQNPNLAAMMAEEGMSAGTGGRDQHGESAESAVSAARDAAAAAVADAVVTIVEEKLNVKMTRDGSASMTVKGMLDINCQQPEATCVRILLDRGNDKDFKFQCHPNTNKKVFQDENAIALKETKKGFPQGTTVSVVRWRSGEMDESAVPLSINCWPNDLGNGMVTLTIDYTLQGQMGLDNVVIAIPLPTGDAPHVKECEQGTYVHNTTNGTFEWHIENISNSNPDGSIEVDAHGDDADSFFPIHVQFQSSDTLCPIGVRDVITSDGGKSVRFSTKKSMVVQNYSIE